MSIRQNPQPTRLPDFYNLGVMLRILLAVNLLAFCAALARNSELARLPGELVELSASVEPTLIASVILLGGLSGLLARMNYVLGVATVTALCAGLTAFLQIVFNPMLFEGVSPSLFRAALLAAIAALAVLFYFNLRNRAYSPALAEARLMALTARIRPHFLFNSLNAVLGVIRSDPQRAERALEELSDLFRVLMAENRELVPFGDEVALCRQYLDLERLRLGERLQVEWDIEACPNDALVPPLMLQPLLENAVYHGVEPSAEPTTIAISAKRHGDEIHIALRNPLPPDDVRHAGNRMALDNIRERLMLFFDLEARLDTERKDGQFCADIRMPYRPKTP